MFGDYDERVCPEMSRFCLYTTDCCHLCDLAKALCEPFLHNAGFTLDIVDIADDETMVAIYGTRIPVLKDTLQDQELGWPFDAIALAAFVQSNSE